MRTKIQPLGICDLCECTIPGDIYTSKGQPRLYCGRLCRNTANSRDGAEIRADKAKARVKNGTWYNPASDFTPEERKNYAQMGGEAAATKFKEQVKAGTWCNPALSESARIKLSRPRTITDPVLHSAQEKLSAGAKMTDLTAEEAESYRIYRRNFARGKKARWKKKDPTRVASMIKLRESGLSYAAIGRLYGVSRQRTCKIIGRLKIGRTCPVRTEG